MAPKCHGRQGLSNAQTNYYQAIIGHPVFNLLCFRNFTSFGSKYCYPPGGPHKINIKNQNLNQLAFKMGFWLDWVSMSRRARKRRVMVIWLQQVWALAVPQK